MGPWRVMPPEKAAEDGFHDRSFTNKKQAVDYQKQVKSRFPDEPCCLVHTGRYFDALGRSSDRRNNRYCCPPWVLFLRRAAHHRLRKLKKWCPCRPREDREMLRPTRLDRSQREKIRLPCRNDSGGFGGQMSFFAPGFAIAALSFR
jgi:hypothetical protein